MKPAIRFAELDAEIGLVDTQANDGDALFGHHLQGLVLRIDVLGGLENGLHDELGGTAARDAIQRRTNPTSLAIDGVAIGGLALAFGVEKDLTARFCIAWQIWLPGGPGGGALQAANEKHQLGDLVVFQGIAQFFHGRLGNAVLDDVGDVRIRAAVAEFFARQVGPLAAAASTAVTAAAQTTEQRLAFGEGLGVGLGLGLFRFLCGLHRLPKAKQVRPQSATDQSGTEHDPAVFAYGLHLTDFSFRTYMSYRSYMTYRSYLFGEM